FTTTQAERVASGDPRPSIAERYPTFSAYDNQLIAAINGTIAERSLLCEDGRTELARLRQLGATRGGPGAPSTFVPYSFAVDQMTIASSQSTSGSASSRIVSLSLSANTPETCSVSCSIVDIYSADGSSDNDWRITGAMTAELVTNSRGNNSQTYTAALYC